MHNTFKSMIVCFMALGVVAFGCSEEEEPRQSETPHEPPVMPQNLSPPEVLEQDALCMGPEPLTTVDWVESADAVAIGTVTDVSPVLEAWLPANGPGEGEFVDPATCDGLHLALRVTIQVESHALNHNVESGEEFAFILPADVTNTWTSRPGVWLDSRYLGRKAEDTQDPLPDGSLEWSQSDTGLSPGLRIAARTLDVDDFDIPVLPFTTPLFFSTDDGWTSHGNDETHFCFDYSAIVSDMNDDLLPDESPGPLGIEGGLGSLLAPGTACLMNRDPEPNLEAESPDPLAP